MASLLKPVDDTRMLEKIGATISTHEELEVFIIGYPILAEINYQNITLLPLTPFKRTSLKRIKATLEVLTLINKVKPELIIINTPELLWVAILNRILFGRKIIYDVLENYYKNILFTESYPIWLRLPLSFLTRLIELISAPLIDCFFLAEKGYENELMFAKPNIILENKLPKEIANKYASTGKVTQLIFTGTIAPTTGIIDAISICEGLHSIDNSYSLTIVGYCAKPDFLEKIKNQIEGKDFIKIIGGDHLVPHPKILEEIRKSGTGIVIYSLNPSTKSSLGTKLYEYIALNKTILIRHNTESHRIVESLNIGIVLPPIIDYTKLDTQLKALKAPIQTNPELYWDAQANSLINCLKGLKILI